MFLDDTLLAFEKAKKEGVKVQLELVEDMRHDYVLCSDIFPEGKRSLDKIASFILEKS